MSRRCWPFAVLVAFVLAKAGNAHEGATLQFAPAPPAGESLLPPPLAPRGAANVPPSTTAEVDLAIKPIGALRTDIALPAAYDARGDQLPEPPNYSAQLLTEAAIVYVSMYGPNGFAFGAWAASPAYCRQPLYFEEINLERYGNSIGLLQPVLSGAHFFGTVPALPYLATVERPWVCYPPEPWYPPAGVAAPWQPPKRYPLRLDASAVEAATITGLILLIP